MRFHPWEPYGNETCARPTSPSTLIGCLSADVPMLSFCMGVYNGAWYLELG